jgi:uncharacterized protein (DUF488 family)
LKHLFLNARLPHLPWRCTPERQAEEIVKPLFTIGYEQSTASAFFDALTQAGVGLLVDVRAVAASRRPGFSKRQLASGLDERGIGYVHLQKLGTPKEGRLAARSGRAAEMLRIFERHLKTPEAQHELDELTAVARALMERSSKPLCLLCYERDPAHCHRLRLANELHARLGLKVEHLFCAPV